MRDLPLDQPDDFDDASERTAVFSQADIRDLASPASSRARAHVLVRMDGSDVGQVITVSGATVGLGRLVKNEVHLAIEGVSREHARLLWQDGSYVIEDLGSANGTFVQGARIERHRLADGDVVQIGPRVTFRYSVTDSDEEKILRQLYESSVRDSLTGCFNREYLNERLKVEVAYARRHTTFVSLLLFDLDHFKKVNDTWGHQAGDAVLIDTVGRLGRMLRTEDVLARYGGEEFAIVLRSIDLERAAAVGERVRAAVSGSPVRFGTHEISCTVSVGCAALECCEKPTVEALIAAADRRLYGAKRAGRNRVVADG